MNISVKYSDREIILKENISVPFYRGDILCLDIGNIRKEIDLFDSDSNYNNIDTFLMKYPNSKQYSLNKLRAVADLFPVLQEKYYDKSKTTTFNIPIGINEASTANIIISNDYVICYAITGGEYSRNPGTNILLVGIKKINEEFYNGNKVNEAKLAFALKDMASMLYSQFKVSSNFEDLDKSIRIIETRNKNHYPSIVKKIRNFTRILYETGAFHNMREEDYSKFINKLKEADLLINDIIK